MPRDGDPSTTIDFTAEGLLDDLDGDARESRERLLRALAEDGVALDELRCAIQENRLVLLPAERAIGGEPCYTGLEMAERSGVDPELLTALRRAQGLPIPDPEARVFTESDLDAARTVHELGEAGVGRDQMLTITRILGRGLAQAAEAMRAVTLEMILEPGATEYDLAMRAAAAAERLAPLASRIVSNLINLHLRNIVQTELLSAAEREHGLLQGTREVAVAFADLVGFTRMGQEVGADELGRVAGRLEQLAGDHLERPVRLVKTIGDAVMLASSEIDPLLRTLLALVEAADAEGEDFPQLRAGVAFGPAFARGGDWYGSTVNLASRLTDFARPASIVVTREIREGAAEDIAFSRIGDKRLRGMREPIRLYRARRAQED